MTVHTVTLGWYRGGIELKQFFRDRASVVFTFTMPAVLLLMLGSILDKDVDGFRGGQLLAASIAAAGIASTSFVGIGTGIATERDDGTLKRLRGTPMPPASFFIGKVLLVLATSLAELALLLAVGVFAFDLVLPADAMKWLNLAWLFILGTTACALSGIATSSLARSARGAGAVVMMPFMILEFISGIFIVPITQIPSPLREIGTVFPLKWLAQGFRAVLLPDNAAALEANHAWDLGRVAVVLAAWCVAGLVLCLLTFRWRSHRTL